MIRDYEWKSEFPKEDGEFYYSGKLPSGMVFVGVVQVYTDLSGDKEKHACVLIPPFWRGDVRRKLPDVVFGEKSKWSGMWAGPEFGLSSCVVG